MNQYQRFELWFAQRFRGPCEHIDGKYTDPLVQLLWECWQKAVDQYE